MMIEQTPALEPREAATAPRVLLTIDTELTWRPDDTSSGWRAAYERSFEAAGVGIAYQLKTLARHALKACFFIDPMPAELYGLDPIRRMVEPILEAGQEIQLHLHPLWVGTPHGKIGDPELASYTIAAQRSLISRARALLVEAGVPEPMAFRGGNFSANDDTLQVLAELGFVFDSSHNGQMHPWPSAIALPADQITPVRHQGMIEVPITVIDDRRSLRHLQVCAVSLAEFKAAITHAEAAGMPIVTIVSHSFELANRAGTAPNKVHVRRFEELCTFLSDNRRRFPTSHFSDLGEIPLGRPSAILPAAPLRRLGRLIEQVWSNQVEERRS
jgi:hypothetical protein